MIGSTTAVYVGRTYLSRNQVSPHDYAEAVHLYELLSEVTKVLLRKNGVATNQVINQFLQQANRGEHVLLKSYGSFSKSVLCKICFLYSFLKIFETQSVSRNGLDYYQLSRLLCSDFPRQFIVKAAALIVPNQQPTNQMYIQFSTKKFAQALYLQMIYTEYLETVQNHFQQEEVLDFFQLYRVLMQEDTKNIKQYTKPPFSIMAQSLLNIMKKKGLLSDQSANLIFITQENIQDFIRDSTTNHPDKSISFNELLQAVLQSRQYCELVEQNIGMFENSTNWANENYKILSMKEPTEAPLNVKKKGSKK